MAIKSIEVSGFRGILTPLKLDLDSRSMIVYGANGTGKSSITDAWEWFQSGEVGHLAREGAGPAAYAHLRAAAKQTSVKVVLKDDALGTISQEFTTAKKPPLTTGDMAKFRKTASHPCQIRYSDLGRFVYYTKTERYGVLAQLMGFSRALEFQKLLATAAKKMEKDIKDTQKGLEERDRRLSTLLDSKPPTEENVQFKLSEMFAKHGIAHEKTPDGLKAAHAALEALVKGDAISKELVNLKIISGCASALGKAAIPLSDVPAYITEASTILAESGGKPDIHLIALYERALAILIGAGEEHVCPVCASTFAGNLREHIEAQLTKLQALKLRFDKLSALREKAISALRPIERIGSLLTPSIEADKDVQPAQRLAAIRERVAPLEGKATALIVSVSTPIEQSTSEGLRTSTEAIEALQASLDDAKTRADAHVESVKKRSDELGKDPDKSKLAEDLYTCNSIRMEWEHYFLFKRSYDYELAYTTELSKIAESFSAASAADVQAKFDQISNDVKTYFGILEKDNPTTTSPRLELIKESERAVTLEVVFHGTPVSPAYRYLSESQLNSFGLSVFLASLKNFNSSFKVMVLDDIVSSFDSHKRPHLITLLKDHFADYQIILLTHDSIWRDRLYKDFPAWVRKHFIRHDIATGPIVRDGQPEMAEILALLAEDKPAQAGQMLGPLLEAELQDLCESFEASVKYTKRNEYTLEPLLDYFIGRVRDKLTAGHPLYLAAAAFKSESGFRNLCSHFKNPEAALTTPELKAAVEKWGAVQKMVRCQEDHCARLLKHSTDRFVCGCGKSVLERPKP